MMTTGRQCLNASHQARNILSSNLLRIQELHGELWLLVPNNTAIIHYIWRLAADSFNSRGLYWKNNEGVARISEM